MKQQGVFRCTFLILVVTIVCLVSAQGFYSSGGRYGKRDSENTMLYQDDKMTRRASRLWSGRGSEDVQQVAPRAERFFMGSRYGKRGDRTTNGSSNKLEGRLYCRYTGVVNFYRCIDSKGSSTEAE